jgi:hypothetical protein
MVTLGPTVNNTSPPLSVLSYGQYRDGMCRRSLTQPESGKLQEVTSINALSEGGRVTARFQLVWVTQSGLHFQKIALASV